MYRDNNPLKICFFITNLCVGGAEKATIKAAELLRQNGHSVHLVLLENIVNFKFNREIKCKIIYDKIKKGLIGKYLMAYKLNRTFCEIERKEGKFNLVVSTLPFCDDIVKAANIPNVYFRIANTLSAEIKNLKISSAVRAERRLKRYKLNYNNQKIIAVSQGVKDDLLNNIKIKSKISVIHNPFNFGHIKKLSSKPIPKNIKKPYVIHVGRFSAQKRHDLLLDAWKLLGLSMNLLLMTNPSVKLERMISERGLDDSVKVIGFKENPYPYIYHSEMLILCSDREGLPNVLVEALVCGTRVISTDCPSGPREILTGALKNCLIPVNNAQLLAKRIKALLKLPKPKDFDLQSFSEKAFLRKYMALARR
ncbi:RfaG Glycosyltransferase [Candidatus Methylopumilus planktonicus]|uniref:glycosyltransferase n=1 Tax=Candidatus Methylopumilus planktonicus TaxID=1581557 RepID=UPI003BEEE54B